jgi:hypothetical protein
MAEGADERPKVISHWDATKVSGQGAWEQKRRLARAMRLVIERLVPSNAPEDELRRAAEPRLPALARPFFRAANLPGFVLLDDARS